MVVWGHVSNSIEQRPSWEGDSSQAGQQFSCFLRGPKI